MIEFFASIKFQKAVYMLNNLKSLNPIFCFLLSSIVFSCSNKKTQHEYSAPVSKIFLEVDGIELNWDFKRNLKGKLKFDKYNDFNLGRGSDLVANSKFLLLSDISNQVVHELDFDLNLKNSFLRKGDGLIPENNFIMSLDIWPNGDFYIYDFGRKIIKSFERNGILKNYSKFHNSSIFRAVYNNTGDFIFLIEPSENFEEVFLRKYNTQNNLIIYEINISSLIGFKPTKELNLIMDGRFSESNFESDFIVFMFSYAGKLMVINEASKIPSVTLIETIDKTSFPQMELIDLGNAFLPKIIPDINFNVSSKIMKDKIYVLNIINKDFEPIIDVYDVYGKGNNYKYSIEIPKDIIRGEITDFTFFKNDFYFITDDQQLLKFKYVGDN